MPYKPKKIKKGCPNWIPIPGEKGTVPCQGTLHRMPGSSVYQCEICLWKGRVNSTGAYVRESTREEVPDFSKLLDSDPIKQRYLEHIAARMLEVRSF